MNVFRYGELQIFEGCDGTLRTWVGPYRYPAGRFDHSGITELTLCRYAEIAEPWAVLSQATRSNGLAHLHSLGMIHRCLCLQTGNPFQK